MCGRRHGHRQNTCVSSVAGEQRAASVCARGGGVIAEALLSHNMLPALALMTLDAHSSVGQDLLWETMRSYKGETTDLDPRGIC